MSHTHTTGARWIPRHPPTALLLILISQVGLSLVPGARSDVPWIVQLLGGGLILGGIALTVAASRRFEQHRTPISPSGTPSSLVTHGVFAWSRNPMYLGFAFVLGGAAAALATPWALAAVPLWVAWMDRLVRVEEARLETVFGEAYRSYRGRVRRWL